MSLTLAKLWRCAGVAALCLLGAACATAPPVQEMSDARQAIAAAREAGAESLATERLQQAEALLAAAEAELQTGLPSGYWAARKAAIDAKETAFDALLISRDAKDRGAEP